MGRFGVRVMGRFLQCSSTFFVSVATILGTGILGLPVKLSRSGFAPFFLTFAACFALQLGAVWLMTDLLQYAHQAIDADVFDRAIEDDDDGEEEGTKERQRWRQQQQQQQQRRRHPPPPSPPPPQPDLGQMCHLYLTPGWQRRGFDSAVVLQFGSILVSYALAGPAAYAAVLGAPVGLITPLFVLGFATIIVTCARRVQPVVAALTCLKCFLLLLTVGVLGVAAGRLRVSPRTHWGSAGDSLLIGTVALGGVSNIMPVMYAAVPKTPAGLRDFRRSLTAGVGFCWLLNAVWCFLVLQVVPQLSPPGEPGAPSLQRAEREGEISTAEVLLVLQRSAGDLRWIEDILNLFNLVSITVSFFTWGAGFVHVLDGVAARSAKLLRAAQEAKEGAAAARRDAADARDSGGGGGGGGGAAGGSPGASGSGSSSGAGRYLRCLAQRRLLHALAFSSILLVALANPKGFVVVMERFTSLSLNLEAGIFVAIMHAASAQPGGIPLPLSLGTGRRLRSVAWAGFGFAVAWDLGGMGLELLGDALGGSLIVATCGGLAFVWLRAQRRRRLASQYDGIALSTVAVRAASSAEDAHALL
jgi:amino acid permease